jgi:hypothetical protein
MIPAMNLPEKRRVTVDRWRRTAAEAEKRSFLPTPGGENDKKSPRAATRGHESPRFSQTAP